MTMVPILVHYNNGHRRGGLMFTLTTRVINSEGLKRTES